MREHPDVADEFSAWDKLRFSWVARGLLVALLLNVAACQQQGQTEQKIKQDAVAASDLEEGRLVLEDATLEQADKDGQTLWKIKAEQTVYSKDKKTAQLENLSGELFQDGKIVLEVNAEQGQVREDGEKIFLKGQIVATDPRNGAVIKGGEVEWRPQEDLLIVSQGITGAHPKLQASAKEGRYLTRKQRLELMGQIVATAKDPRLQMKTEHLLWEIEQEKVIGDRRIQIDRYKGETITDRVEADRSVVNLKTKIATLEQNVELKSLDPLVQIATNSATWNLESRTVVSDKPVRIVDSQEGVTLTANQGQVDLEKEVARLSGGVQGISSRNQAKLFSNQLTWEIPTQLIRAQENVIYEQADPSMKVTGGRAVGKLTDESIVVRGGSNSDDRVVTEIIP